jgi:ABC-type transport system involved in multi-copper enzyme maturation permease subunit
VGYVVQLTGWDLLRRKDMYVMGILMGLYVVGAIVVRVMGVQSVQTAKFLMSLGLTLSQILTALLLAVLCARAFPEEFERRTLMTLLAKPISRSQLVLGKALGCFAPAMGCFVLFILATLLSAPSIPGQSMLVLIQAAVLQMLAFACLGCFSMLLSLYLPTVASVVIAMTWYLAAGPLLTSAENALTNVSSLLARLLACLPNPALLSHLDNFASAVPGLSTGLFCALCAYGIGWTLIFLLLVMRRFESMWL